MSAGELKESRIISVRLLMEGGHEQTLELAENSPELLSLFQALGSRSQQEATDKGSFFQLPVDGGQEAFSFHSSQLVSIATRPPVVVEFEQGSSFTPDARQPVTRGAAVRVERPKHLVIDDFLSPAEHRDMLAYALQCQEQFVAGTTGDGPGNARENLVILGFSEHPHSRLLCNRLITCFPGFLRALDIPPFPVEQLESQLTASNDGHYYRAHLDIDNLGGPGRVLTCVYYFSAQPAQFAGGALRLYDALKQAGERHCGEDFQEIEPLANRLVVFPSDSYHELMPIECPSRRFEDSRFAVTNWFWRAAENKPTKVHGWGHYHATVLPPGFSRVPGKLT